MCIILYHLIMERAIVLFVTVISIILQEGSTTFVNVAMNKTAYQTSDWMNLIAGFAVDGELTQCSETTDTQWEVDLGDNYLIDHVVIYNRDDCCMARLQEMEVYLGQTRGNYSLRAYQPGEWGYVRTLQLGTNAQGRWLMITRRTPNDSMKLCEVQVMVKQIESPLRFKITPGRLADGIPFATEAVRSTMMCAYLCQLNPPCVMAEYRLTNGGGQQCSLYDTQANKSDNNQSNVIIMRVDP